MDFGMAQGFHVLYCLYWALVRAIKFEPITFFSLPLFLVDKENGRLVYDNE